MSVTQGVKSIESLVRGILTSLQNFKVHYIYTYSTPVEVIVKVGFLCKSSTITKGILEGQYAFRKDSVQGVFSLRDIEILDPVRLSSDMFGLINVGNIGSQTILQNVSLSRNSTEESILAPLHSISNQYGIQKYNASIEQDNSPIEIKNQGVLAHLVLTSITVGVQFNAMYLTREDSRVVFTYLEGSDKHSMVYTASDTTVTRQIINGLEIIEYKHFKSHVDSLIGHANTPLNTDGNYHIVPFNLLHPMCVPNLALKYRFTNTEFQVRVLHNNRTYFLLAGQRLKLRVLKLKTNINIHELLKELEFLINAETRILTEDLPINILDYTEKDLQRLMILVHELILKEEINHHRIGTQTLKGFKYGSITESF